MKAAEIPMPLDVREAMIHAISYWAMLSGFIALAVGLALALMGGLLLIVGFLCGIVGVLLLLVAWTAFLANYIGTKIDSLALRKGDAATDTLK